MIPDRKTKQALVFFVGDQLLKPAVPCLLRIRSSPRGIRFRSLSVVVSPFDGLCRVFYFAVLGAKERTTAAWASDQTGEYCEAAK
jgi:hypothetical protein